ncbi:MAG: Nif3-like dinuclear metal center hexameric protein [Flavobacteriales bacterium]|nr:Nif3-like dinuclear metal center hexameric protein [Flavobacteriales bacterium]
MIIKDITTLIEDLAPLHLQEDYDNCGLNIGDINAEVKGVLVSLDCTEAIIEEAIAKDCNLVVVHHPLLFGDLKNINPSNWLGRTVIKAISNNVAVYASHTCLDNVVGGVNSKICEKIGLIDTEFLIDKEGNYNAGSGMIGYLKEEMLFVDFMNFIKKEFSANGIRYTQPVTDVVKKIAVCGGSGSFLLDSAISKNADVFITGDFKYHQFFDSNSEIAIADIGHYESEQFTTEVIYSLIKKKFPKFAIHFSGINTSPIKYLI